MTEEATKEIDVSTTEETEEVESEAAATTATHATAASKSGTDFLDFSKLDDRTRAEVEPRFKHLYRHVKEGNRSVELLTAQNEALMKRLEEIAEGQAELATGVRNRENADAAALIRTKLKEAYEQGNYDKAVELTEKLAELKAQPAPKPEVKAAPPPSSTELAINAWANEIDDSGAPRRPWAQEGHPKRDAAINMTLAVLNDPDWKGRPIHQALAEVDRRMSPTPRQAATVLKPNGDARRMKADLPQLSVEQKYVAERMFTGMKPNEAHARYAKQLKHLGKA